MSATTIGARPPTAAGGRSGATGRVRARTDALGGVLDDVVILVRDTLQVFVRVFPQILAIWLAGWLGSTLVLKVASLVADVNGWAALAVFSLSFLCTLVAIVLVLRVCGIELGIRSLLPADEAAQDDGRDTSLTRLLAVTLLPFLGLYAAFGQVQDRAALLQTEQVYRNSVFGPPSILATVRGLVSDHQWWFVALLVGIYVLRRVVDAVHERTSWRPLGFAVATIESFFILVVIFGGFLLFSRAKNWLATRQLSAWVDAVQDAVVSGLRAIHLGLPAVLARFWAFLTGDVWPLLAEAVGQPIIWLAVAALVYGSRVLSLADLWRRGLPLAARVPGMSTFDPRRERRPRAVAPAGVARLGSEVKEAFLGDVDDKYLPTLHSLRLVLRAGTGFLAAFVLVYSVLAVGRHYVIRGYEALFSGQDVNFWYRWGPAFDLVENIPWELLRLCLLAVAFRRCLELFERRTPAEGQVDTSGTHGTSEVAP